MKVYLVYWMQSSYNEIQSAVVVAPSEGDALQMLRSEVEAQSGHFYGDVPDAEPVFHVVDTTTPGVVTVATNWA